MEPILDPEHRELEEQLMRAGRDVHMSAALRAKTLAAVGAATVGVTAASSAQASTLGWLSSKGGTFWAASLLGGAGVVGAAVVVATGLQGEPEAASRSLPPAPVLTEQATFEAAPSAQEEEVPAVELDVSEVPVEPPVEPQLEDEGAARSEPVLRAPSRARPAQPSSTLGEELTYISRVEKALRAGNPSAALASLAEYRKRFSRPQLGLEAEVLTIQALHESGSTAAAQQRAERFIQRYPKSPLGVRAKQYLK